MTHRKRQKIMNGDITSAALCHCQRASKVISVNGQSSPPVRSPLVLVTPVKRPPDEMPYAVKSPLGQNVFCLFSLGLCFVSICFFDVFVSPHSFMYTPLRFFGAIVTNLNEPHRAITASTVAWVRS